MTNIRDLAKMAGVSVTTVSRVLNQHPYVSEEKKQKVLEAIERSNYHRNLNAVHLSKGKTFLIGVVIPFTEHPYFGLIIKGIANEALVHNHHLVLIQTNYEVAREQEALNMLKQKQIDALIICSRKCDWSAIDEYLQYGPIILFEDTRGKRVSSIFVDHYKTFDYALEYLKSRGHQEIAYCIGRTSGTNSQARESAYKNFLKKNNLPFKREYIFDNCLYIEDGERVVERIKQMSTPPTAILATSDQVAVGIITSCQQRNISIPGDLALIGFNNEPIAKMMNITTIEIPLIEIGRRLFLQSIEHGVVSYQEISVNLIERKTV
ncbi:LacI family DNA-binding transcriptional regulator [Neobacillus cucumis]|nr:LacI family DNA-binding transcriptional regulator [Neobacillus cucumis]